MKRIASCLLIACAMLALAACSSAPIHFYTLVPPPTKAAHVGSAAYDIAVMPVTVPAQVDRAQMVVREGPSSVALLDGRQWIAPLGAEIRQALSAELTRQLGTRDVYGTAHPEGTPVYRINVDVQRFESVPGQYTMLVATWAVRPLQGKGQVTSCTVHVRESVGQGYAALVQGHQQGLATLAHDIARALGQLANGNAVHCRAPAD